MIRNLAVLSTIICLFYSCENKKEDIQKYASTEITPVETIENAEILYSEEGEVKVKVLAALIEKYAGKEPYSEMTKGIEVIFYDSAMNVTSRLTANYAIDRISENIMEAKDKVVVINEKKEMLETEHLIWDKKEAKIYSNVHTTITTEDERIKGDGFVSNQEFTKYKIIKPIGTISGEE